jgi:hypothetical protein
VKTENVDYFSDGVTRGGTVSILETSTGRCFPIGLLETDICRLRRLIVHEKIQELTVNVPLVSLQIKNTNNAKSEVRFKQLYQSLIRGAFTIDSSTPTLRINLNEHLI